jgi:hypothetical protein
LAYKDGISGSEPISPDDDGVSDSGGSDLESFILGLCRRSGLEVDVRERHQEEDDDSDDNTLS